ncbi:PP2C-domain-containing protein [Xylona heveae TC161]|uniref:Adenylate cyclase n=1 Tax=Xylona heveae (strain CBS 132557 / TC161) TaxID=1328760 RepID=A0A165GMQ3_XYLHT|nr:PP2C-domain-containing protein [Xylona heveae TC161]KZF22381.1 PP2C-domain-containing protein [Xylona heveae TC161]
MNDDRRPSVASANTVSSTGSRGSTGRIHRKLHGMFGDDQSGRESRQGSNTSLPMSAKENSNQSQRGRDHFLGEPSMSRSESPFGSRPRTPLPSSDVVPWVFQDFKDIPNYGDAPIREAPSSTDIHRYAGDNNQADRNNGSSTREPHQHSHRFHLHRHHKSKEDAKPPPRDQRTAELLRTAGVGDGSALSLKGHPAFSSRASVASGATSPTPSSYSATNRDPMNNMRMQSNASKRSLFDKFKRGNRHKDDKGAAADELNSLPGSTRSLVDNQNNQNMAPKPSRLESSTGSLKRRGPSLAGSDITLKPGSQDHGQPAPISRKESMVPKVPGHGRLKGAVRRGLSSDVQTGKDLASRKGSQAINSWFDLDTDLSRMEGIVTQPPPLHPADGEVFAGGPTTDEQRSEILEVNASRGSGAWDAPDSWAVKKVGDDNMSRLPEIDEAGIPHKDVDDGHQYCIRIFRADSTFATLSTGLNSTATEILHTLGRKSFLQDELGNYQIILRKHDLQRQLEAGERPVAIQKRLLEQAGYTSKDHIDEIGREDNSYLCRFTFVPAKLSGFSSLERDPGFSKMQKFSHIDLQGRNLITIPITLYRKATEIISLNLSRNLSLDVPKDFIHSCINLRELKYVSNEAWHLPPSLSLASRLTVLDISNNKLEQLEHADLSKLTSLVSIKLANNKLKYLPEYFGDFTQLRSLNLSSNYLESFPDFLCRLKSLVDLDISFNAIKNLPDIGQLTTLERFWATNNRLTGSFPEGFKELSSLKELDVRYNALSNIDVVAQLPQLEQLMAGHNSVPGFTGTFEKIRTFYLNHNPVTRFTVTTQIPTMTTLSIASAKLSELQDDFAEQLPNLTRVILDNNHLVSLGPQIGKLRKLEHLSLAKNQLNNLPAEIGLLQELRFLDLRENNLKKLPSEIWCALRLDTLNVCSNVLDVFPKPPPLSQLEAGVNNNLANPTGGVSSLSSSPSFEELGKLEDFQARRPSHASSTLLSVGSSPATSYRKGSIASMYGPGGRKTSTTSRTPTDGMITPVARKDSSFSTRVASTFAGSLRHLFLADNRLTDDVFDEITLLPELRILNLSYNELYDIPQRSLRRWPHLAELFVSGNELSSLPSDDFEEGSSLKVLHINANKFQVLPAELGKVNKLTILDVGSNSLKYNVSNWPYDWNWNWNHNLKYLNLSGNKRLEIKPNPSSYNYGSSGAREGRDLTNFNSLTSLRVLGLMDVTLTIPSVPEQTEDRRVRTSGSLAGSMTYGMADSLGRNEHLSTIDMIVPKFRGHETETLLGMFDGQALSSGGSKVAKFLQENFSFQFGEELKRLESLRETPVDALRRAFLALNKDLATVASQSMDEKELRGSQLGHRGSIVAPILSSDDLASGSVATVLFLQGMELYVANVGDAQAMLVHSEGGYRILTRKHDPAEPSERQRIREAGGYVSRQGKLNDVLDVSRAFGYTQLMPAVMAAPHVSQITLKEQDEMVLIASKELWQYLTPDVAVDIARQERGDLMRAAQKLRDLAIAFGATGKIMVIMIGVGDLKKRERARNRAQSMSMGPLGSPDEQVFSSKRGKRPRDAVNDSTLARLDQEVEAPTGDVSLVFTDIKNSTLLWETYPIAMRSAIKIHNSIMRRQLRIIGGYEVKTEGDAFMVCFPTATSALLWCFSVQSLLLEAPWPSEILNSVHGQEVQDADGNVIFRGLSVRMGIHWGCPVCEPDPITNRMDYFGPMVNRASRISAVADGGQITVSSDFITEIQRTLEAYSESDRTASTGSEDSMYDDAMGQAIRRELRSLSSQGFEVKELGERKLKGLENPEYVYLMFPHSLAGRLIVQQQQQADAEAAQAANNPGSKSKDSQLTIDTQMVWDLWSISLRLEMLCSTLECPGSTELKAPETAILERMKSRGGEVTDRFLVNFVEHQVSRIETCTTTLAMRHLVRPFRAHRNILEDACPMGDIFAGLHKELADLKALKARLESGSKN